MIPGVKIERDYNVANLCDLVNNRLCEIANLNNDETIVDKHTIKHVSFEDALKELIELKKANNK
jgi:hypothetical protein